MLDQARDFADAINIPPIGDGDTGYDRAMNVRRAFTGLAKWSASVMFEEQRAPKHCDHTPRKAVVARDEASDRIRAAVDGGNPPREEGGKTLDLPYAALHHMGHYIAACPLSLLATAMQAMEGTLREMRDGERHTRMSFDDLRQRIGFEDYKTMCKRDWSSMQPPPQSQFRRCVWAERATLDDKASWFRPGFLPPLGVGI
ncbi:hypothetical protein [uncultured Roseobacter sp.]|uniref:hypothetical protein n=1 Tax=uncultured Roseobacter sp. TaxID=114847 RepID=UPI0026220A03|nr:hypothetical protein [uncultured Roseobacter sp.]